MSRSSPRLAGIRFSVPARGSAPRRRPQRGSRFAFGALAGFGVIVVSAVAVGELLRLAERADGSTAFDRQVTLRVVAHRADGLTMAARALSLLGSSKVLLPVVAGVALALGWRRRVALATGLVVAWGGSIGLYNLTKLIVDRRRPPPALRLVSAAGSSFPSGHATQSLATYVALVVIAIAVLPRARWPAWMLAGILAAGVGWSRVYLGVHWATDVGAGWMIAGCWITVVVWLTMPARFGRQPVGAERSGNA